MSIIGTMRPEEARVFDSFAVSHSFHASETQEPIGSFEIFHNDREICDTARHDGRSSLCHVDTCIMAPGWYWQAGFPGCLPDGDPMGPFATSRQALEDADEWNPEFDD